MNTFFSLIDRLEWKRKQNEIGNIRNNVQIAIKSRCKETETN